MTTEDIFMGLVILSPVIVFIQNAFFHRIGKLAIETEEGMRLTIQTAYKLLESSNLTEDEKHTFSTKELSPSYNMVRGAIFLFFNLLSVGVGFLCAMITPEMYQSVGQVEATIMGVVLTVICSVLYSFLFKNSSFEMMELNIKHLEFKTPEKHTHLGKYVLNPYSRVASAEPASFYADHLPEGVTFLLDEQVSTVDSVFQKGDEFEFGKTNKIETDVKKKEVKGMRERKNVENLPPHIEEMKEIALDWRLPREVKMRAKKQYDQYRKEQQQRNYENETSRAMVAVETVEKYYDEQKQI